MRIVWSACVDSAVVFHAADDASHDLHDCYWSSSSCTKSGWRKFLDATESWAKVEWTASNKTCVLSEVHGWILQLCFTLQMMPRMICMIVTEVAWVSHSWHLGWGQLRGSIRIWFFQWSFRMWVSLNCTTIFTSMNKQISNSSNKSISTLTSSEVSQYCFERPFVVQLGFWQGCGGEFLQAFGRVFCCRFLEKC